MSGSPVTGSRSRAGSCPTRAAASGRSASSESSPACGTSPPSWPSRRAGAVEWWRERARRLGPHVRPQRRAVGARRGGERARADRGRPRADRDRRRLDRCHARAARRGPGLARSHRAPGARGTHARAQPGARSGARSARGTTRRGRHRAARAPRAPARVPRLAPGRRAPRHRRARGRRGRTGGRAHPSAGGRHYDPARADPAQSLRALGGHDATGARRAGGRVRRHAAGRAGLRPLDAPEPARAAGEPARAARGAPPPARARHGGARRRAARRRGARALAGGAERGVPLVVRALRRAPGPRARAARRVAPRAPPDARRARPPVVVWSGCASSSRASRASSAATSPSTRSPRAPRWSARSAGGAKRSTSSTCATGSACSSPLRPLSPYAVSKVTQDLMGWQYFKSYGMHIVRARAFNHDGPRRGETFATSNFAKQIAEIEVGLREPVVLVGDLKPTRDFSDVRDIVRGYWTLLERGTPGEVYNLCSGVDWSIERVLTFLVGKSTAPRIEIRQDPARLRPSDVPILRGSRVKVEPTLGWRPAIPLETTLTDLLEYWRRRIRSRVS